MVRHCGLYLMTLLSVFGCSQTRFVAEAVGVESKTVTVTADDPFIHTDDGEMIPVDGVPLDQPMQLRVTRFKDRDGRGVEDWDVASESATAASEHRP